MVALSCKRTGLGLFKGGDWKRGRTKTGCSIASRGEHRLKGKAAETWQIILSPRSEIYWSGLLAPSHWAASQLAEWKIHWEIACTTTPPSHLNNC
jgi:hypothetical protein